MGTYNISPADWIKALKSSSTYSSTDCEKMGNELVKCMGKDGWNGITYSELVKDYWNWLVGPALRKKLFYDNLFYMRANHDYKVDDKGNRQNFERKHHESVNVSTNTIIFCPVTQAEYDDGYLTEKGIPIDSKTMLDLALKDLEDWTHYSPSIRNTAEEKGTPIVDNMEEYKIKCETFPIYVPNNSELGGYMDDPFLGRTKPYTACTVGYYIAFQFVKDGIYTVVSNNENSKDGKTSAMDTNSM